MVRKISGKINIFVREKSGTSVSGQGISKSLFKVSETVENIVLRLPRIIIRLLCII